MMVSTEKLFPGEIWCGGKGEKSGGGGEGNRLEQNDYLGERFSACRSTDETFQAPTRVIIKIYRD